MKRYLVLPFAALIVVAGMIAGTHQQRSAEKVVVPTLLQAVPTASVTVTPTPAPTLVVTFTPTPVPTVAPTPIAPPPPTPIAVPSCECDSYVKAVIKQTFSFDPGTAMYVVERESSFDPAAYHENWNGTVDLGLFQINSIHAWRWEDYWTAWSDPARNAQWALELYMEQGWRPWRI